MCPMSFAGRLLVATPLIGDPHFERSVVLVLTHDENGAFGLVLNRPSETPVAEVVPDWAPLVNRPDRIFIGGPVAPDAVVAIARLDASVTTGVETEGFSPLAGGLGSVDLSRPPEPGCSRWSGLRLFAGSSGWAVGQLEDELNEGAWWLVPGEPHDPLTTDPAALWRRVLRHQSGPTAWFANCPLDPTAN